MASLIKIKRSEVSGNPAVLGAGELAYSGLADNGSNGGDRLYIGMGTETAGNAVNHVVIGGKYFTDQINAATSANTASTLVRRDASGNISVGTITGTLSGNASTATKWATARNLSLTGDATATLTGVDGSAAVSAAITLATVNSNVGSFGSSTAIPIVTVNAKGLVTAVSTATISTALSIAGGTGTDTVTLGTDTLTFAGGTGVATTVTNNQVSFAIGQAVGTTDNVTFNNVAVNGTLSSDDITAANISVAGNATITGNLTVQGTTTTINSTTIAVGDLNIVLAKDAATASAANGAGITVNGPTTAATLIYSSSDDRWNLNKDLNVANVYGALQGNAATATKWATARSLSLTGDATATLTSVDGSADVSAAITLANTTVAAGSYGSASSVATFTVDSKGRLTAAGTATIAIDAGAVTTGTISAARLPAYSGDASSTAGTTTLTLATVNANVGSFGSGTSVPNITVNAKGLVTAVSTTAIPTATASVLGLASFNSTDFTVSGGAVTIAQVDGGTY